LGIGDDRETVNDTEMGSGMPDEHEQENEMEMRMETGMETESVKDELCVVVLSSQQKEILIVNEIFVCFFFQIDLFPFYSHLHGPFLSSSKNFVYDDDESEDESGSGSRSGRSGSLVGLETFFCHLSHPPVTHHHVTCIHGLKTSIDG
jgi:hypothetical protein